MGIGGSETNCYSERRHRGKFSKPESEQETGSAKLARNSHLGARSRQVRNEVSNGPGDWMIPTYGEHTTKDLSRSVYVVLLTFNLRVESRSPIWCI